MIKRRKHSKITTAPLPFELADGSTSVKDFLMSGSRNNRFKIDKYKNKCRLKYKYKRFTSAFLAKKNRIVPPTKVLHFFGISKCDEEEIEELFVGAEAPRPNKVKWVESKKEKAENSEKGSAAADKVFFSIGNLYAPSVPLF